MAPYKWPKHIYIGNWDLSATTKNPLLAILLVTFLRWWLHVTRTQRSFLYKWPPKGFERSRLFHHSGVLHESCRERLERLHLNRSNCFYTRHKPSFPSPPTLKLFCPNKARTLHDHSVSSSGSAKAAVSKVGWIFVGREMGKHIMRILRGPSPR